MIPPFHSNSTLNFAISILLLCLPARGASPSPTPVLGGADVGAAFKNEPSQSELSEKFWSKGPGLDDAVTLPPAWAFGVLYGAYTDQAGALAKAKRLIANDFLIDALWIDSAFWDLSTRGPAGYINFTGDTTAFPDVQSYWREMHELGLRNGIWTWDRINSTEKNYAEFQSNGFFKETISGNGWHNSGLKAEAGLVDFDNPAAAARWSDLMTPLITKGLDFFKIDSSPTPGYLRTHFELSQKALLAKQGRGFILSHPRNFPNRPEFMKGFPGIWTSDCEGEWDTPPDPKTFRSGGFKQQIEKFANPASGSAYLAPFLATDTGGYWIPKSKTPAERDELYQRWTQFSAFGPLMEVFSDRSNSGGNEPLAYSPAAQENFRRYTQLRMRLFPYIYTHALLTRLKSQRMVRGDGVHPTQYWFGDDFWVAPVCAPVVKEWNVNLPAGQWVNYWNGESVDGGQEFKVATDLETLPLFVRAGAIIPMRNYARTIERGTNDPLTLDVYPNGESAFTLLEDDGLSLDYENDKIARTTIDCVEEKDRLRITIDPAQGDYHGRNHERTYIIKLRNSRSPEKVTVNGELLAPVTGDLDATTGWRRWTAEGQVAPETAEKADLYVRFQVATDTPSELIIEKLP